MTGLRKRLVSGVTVLLMVGATAGAAFATTEYVGGGTWDYGKANGTVYSNYLHNTRVHRSSVKVGSTVTRSQCTSARYWSRVAAGTSVWSSESAYWAYC